MKEFTLTQEDKADAARLKAIAESSGLTQEQIGAELGLTQGMIGHMLNGRRKIHMDAAIQFSNLFKVPISEFSPSTQAKINSAYNPVSDSELSTIITKFKDLPLVDKAAILDIVDRMITLKIGVENVTKNGSGQN